MEGLPLFSLCIFPVGSLQGLLVGFLSGSVPLVLHPQVMLSLGGGPPKRLVVILRLVLVKTLTALIARGRAG